MVDVALPRPGRHAELAGNLARVRDRLSAACELAGRDATSVTLVAVTKTYPASDVRLLAELGVTDVGENRDQEAAPKTAALAADPTTPPLRWHFIGQLQRNKCRSVAAYADVVQSVDRVGLVRALAAAAGRLRDRPLDVLVQVSLDDAAGRGGVSIGSTDAEYGLWPVVEAIRAESGLRLAGVMAVAPLQQPPGPAFARLADVAAQVRGVVPTAGTVSAGMSADLEAAIANGATHVRIGSALLGNRPTLR
ncbi:YggS family pyridoxal phosphate-dependent enzyme [Solwaraspora sp. WMMD406]|uniref:YggS family pyridoxal phosphate-dependent enzyme n=1 Tax=Solwaraspora sp. WMMD406 TaxID=3016095 RepID=UPI002416ED28|nr:YggS family pyridoxal phosphate-dependent enzyme [Solwaraspora sp. WMMD406]MDG4765342.1 YggS family pyridoxal phosphate-dependent enzyme [Solwaraspora sp. WMMD406]